MKNFIKDYLPGLISVAVIAISLVLFLSPEPAAFIKNGAGWVLVRAIAFVWSVFIAVGTYSNWINIGGTLNTLLQDLKKVDDEDAKQDDEDANTLLGKISLVGWTVTWVVFVQIMTCFYVAEWCVGGV